MLTRCVIVATLAAYIFTAGHSIAADAPPALTKAVAAQVLGSMGYDDIQVGAVIQGYAPMVGSRNSAFVLAVGRRNGNSVKIESSFQYDDDMGWFYYEFDESTRERDLERPTRLRFWTAKGYSELSARLDDTSKTNTLLLQGVRKWTSDSGASEFRPDGQYIFKPKGEQYKYGKWFVRGPILTMKLDDGGYFEYTMSAITTNSFTISDKRGGSWTLTPVKNAESEQ